MPHRHVTLPPSSFCRFSINRDDPIHNIIHPLQQGAQLLIFWIISLASFVGKLIIQAIFPSDKRVPRSTRWKQKLHLSQTLCNNNKSKPSWLMWKSWLARMKNCERRWNPRMQNVGEQVKSKWRRIKLSSQQAGQDLRRRFHEGGEWALQHEEGDGRFEGRTHHSLMKYWTVPTHQNSVSHSWSCMTILRIHWITSNHSRCWCCCRWPQTRWCVRHS